MKYAVISDIHSNLEALTSVLSHIEQQHVDEIVCCGDLVGYYANPNECIQILQDNHVLSIAGNHDLAAAGVKEDLSSFWEVAHKAILWTRSVISDNNRLLLKNLPRTLVVNNHFLMFHGALHVEQNPEDLHLVREDDVRATMQAMIKHDSNIKLGFFGHSHRDIVYRFQNGQLEILTERELILEPDSYYMINPGSVGQPRDGNPRLSYLTYDNESGKVQFFRLNYNVKRCIRKAAIAGIWRPRWFRRTIDLLNRIQNRLRQLIFK